MLPPFWRSELVVAVPAQPSDGMKKEMENLVEKLGADGIEARRQVRLTVQLCYPVPLYGSSVYLQHLLVFHNCSSYF